MNTYIINSKVRLIKEAKKDFFDCYGIEHTPFTRKQFFYFFEYEGRKYVHKESLHFVLTNADTYTYTLDPYHCELTKQYEVPDIIGFLESYEGSFLPQLVDTNDKFLVYEIVDGDPVESVTEEEFFYIKEQLDLLTFTPFYNSMTYNMVRNNTGIKLIDFKHFEVKDDKPFFVYFFNEDNCINSLYIERGTDLDKAMQHVAIDYPVSDAHIVCY